MADSKCIIFPKGKTTWEGFVPPCQFKDGDVISDGKFIAIFHKFEDGHLYYRCWYNKTTKESKYKTDFGIGYYYEYTYATEEEKEKLFQAIKDNGYKWNAETKTLEKLVEPKFKVGDKVLWNYDTRKTNTISNVTLTENRGYVYWIDTEGCSSGWWGENELTPIPNKFDITTLKPFDRVLVNDNISKRWRPNLFGCLRSDDDYPYEVIGGVHWRCCIPYEGNEHLLGTTDDCDDFYKTWE
jgi:hypothetical protein